MRKYHFFKLINNFGGKFIWIVPALYFVVYSIIIYRFFGGQSLIFYIAEVALIAAMFWGFLDRFRAAIALVIFGLIFVHFLIGSIYTSALFLITPFLLFNMRDLGAIAVVVLVILMPYSIANSDTKTWDTSRTEMAELYSSILFNYPEYDRSDTRASILIDMVSSPRMLDLRLKYHLSFDKYEGDNGKWVVVDGYEKKDHPEYERLQRHADRMNESKEEKKKKRKDDVDAESRVNKYIDNNTHGYEEDTYEYAGSSDTGNASNTSNKSTCVEGEYTSTVDNLNVRRFPDGDAERIKTLSKGEVVCGSVKKNGWIYLDEHQGWSSGDFLNPL